MNEYIDQANKFLTDTNSSIDIEFKDYEKHFVDDKEKRFTWNVTIKRGERSYTLKYGGSLQDVLDAVNKNVKLGHTINKEMMIKNYPVKTVWEKEQLEKRIKIITNNPTKYVSLVVKKPTSYDILACITKYDPDSLEHFCSEFGYDTDSKKAEKIYNAVKEEWLNIAALYNDAELDLLREIN